MEIIVKKTLDDYLNEVDYSWLNGVNYKPSKFALTFANFIKLVGGEQGEANKTPPVHLAMLDKIATSDRYIANICFRGSAKALAVTTPLLTENGWSTVGKVQKGERIFGEDGELTTILAKSDVFHKPMYRLHLKDGRTLDVSEDHINVIIHRRVRRNPEGKCETYYQRREVTTKELLNIPLGSTRTKTVKNPKGWENSVWIPTASPIQFPEKQLPIDPYALGILIGDGSFSRKTGYARLHCHVNDFPHYKEKVPYTFGKVNHDKRNPNVISVGVLQLGKQIKKWNLNCHGDAKFIPQEYLYSSVKQRLELLQGLLDTDGTVNSSTCSFASNSKQLAKDVLYLVYSLGGYGCISERTTQSGKQGYRVSFTCPIEVFSLPRKVAKKKGKFLGKVPLVRIEKIEDSPSQCLMVDNASKTFLAKDFFVTHNTSIFCELLTLYLAVFGELPHIGNIDGMIYVSDTMDNGVKSAKNNIKFRYENSDFLQKWIKEATFIEGWLEFIGVRGNRLGVKMYGAMSGIRGSKIYAKRPVLAVLDDLIPENADKSPTVLENINNVIYKGVNHALDIKRRKVIFSGTPFSKDDPITQAVESGKWTVNVWPVCKEFPVEKEEFQGAWEDRFNYEYVKEQYELARDTGKLASFNQELMLRIAAEEERVIQDVDIRWYKKTQLLEKKGNFNFYITSDFATTDKQKSDYSVILVWAYNSNGDWFLVDGICARQLMDKTVNDMFRLAQAYEPQQVGVETSGQQGAFIKWFQSEMMQRNIWFNFAQGSSGEAGIRPVANKMARFNLVVPWFKAGKIYFPEELKQTNFLSILLGQLKLVTTSGIKGKDDCIDAISMLAYLSPWKPSVQATPLIERNSVYEEIYIPETPAGISSYIV